MCRLIKIGFALLLVSLIAGCSLFDTRAQVRFQNGTSDLEAYYGIGLGDAKYNGDFPPGMVTDYYRTEAGTYSVQLKTSTGSWVTDSAGSTSVVNSHKYTISMLGSYAGGYGYYLTMDE
jgi:hypothetical protein